MRMRWFGESWLAPVCDPDFKIATPNAKCLGCVESILPTERGIAMGFGPVDERDMEKFGFFVVEQGGPVAACAYHIDCHLESVVPGMAFVDRVGERTVELGYIPDEDEPWPYRKGEM